MRRSRTWALLLATCAAILVLVALVSQTSPLQADHPSVWNRRPRGLSAAFAYLKARGWDARSWEGPLRDLPAPPGLLVLAAPLSGFLTDEDRAAVDGWLAHGGAVLLLLSGDTPGLAEYQLDDWLHLVQKPVPPDPPLAYGAWREWHGRVVSLSPAGGSPTAARAGAVVRAGTARAQARDGAKSVLEDEGGAAWVFSMTRARGTILVVNNASMWGNGWIQRPGNLEQLEDTLAMLAPPNAPVLFDEWHHGRRAAVPSPEQTAAFGAFELMIGHVLLLYLLALWTLSRPSGPRLSPAAATAPPLERSLFALAALHRRAGHAGEASRILVESARLTMPGAADLPPVPPPGAGERGLLALARRIGRIQREGA